jgi:hypothetical protein
MKRLFILLFSIASLLSAQPKQYITIPSNPWEFTEARSANVYLAVRENNLKDTVVNIYIGKKVYWGIYTFGIDSIRDRGDNRQVLFSTKFKTQDTSSWRIIKDRFVPVGDTVLSHHKTDTLGRTSDSTMIRLSWLRYTTHPDHTANIMGQGAGIYMCWGITDTTSLTIWLEKINGSPTAYGGANQQPKLHFQLRTEPDSVFIKKYMSP